MKAYTLLEVGYTTESDKTYITLLVKGKDGKKELKFEWKPYFLITLPEEEWRDKPSKEQLGMFKERLEHALEELDLPAELGPQTERYFGTEKRIMWKVYTYKPAEIIKVKHALKRALEFKAYEHDIPFKKRFVADMQIPPLSEIKVKEEKGVVSAIKEARSREELDLNMAAFDIETYNLRGISNPEEDPIIIITYKDKEEEHFFSTKGANAYPNEASMLEHFDALVKEKDIDVLVGYNSSVFDLPYIRERAKRLRAKLDILADGRKQHHGLIEAYSLKRLVHWDLYPTVRLFSTIGVIKAQRLTLAEVYKAVFGKEKFMVNRAEIWELWDENDIELMRKYALGDSRTTFELAEELLPLELEIAKLASLSLFDASISTSGQLVEDMLIYHAAQRKHIIPSKPIETEIARRFANPIEGAYVKLPDPGVYENIAVVDFRSMYPSIIVSYNVDPFTLVSSESKGKSKKSRRAEHEEHEKHEESGKGGEVWISPKGHAFKKKPKGLIPSVLEELYNKRSKLKDLLKKLEAKNKGSKRYKRIKARVRALKILSNSFYGYLGYARSRWYCRECAESITAWARHHIKETEKMAEKRGFKVLYVDTDSVFLLMGNKKKEDVYAFLDEVNKILPGKMELDLEDFYTRALFVSKRNEGKGAKKKYAMLSESGEIKIKGFELVRRDWAKIARDTQKAVLEAILRKGKKEKAMKIVQDVLEKIRKGEFPVDEMVIYTQLKKDPKDYEAKSPELTAAKRWAEYKHFPLKRGIMVGYVITKKGKSISDKAWPVELAKDYDPDYYINNQVLPAVMKILKELGIDEQQLREGLKQNTLMRYLK